MMIELTEEQIDDILFYARTGQLEELQTCIKELPQAKSTSEGDIVIAAVEDQSQNTSLHMAAANGQLGTDLLEPIQPLYFLTFTRCLELHT